MLNNNFQAVDKEGYNTYCCSLIKIEGRGLSVDENWPTSDNMVINL
jgi:hypothetical protein